LETIEFLQSGRLSEEETIELIFNSFEKLGFCNHIRIRLAIYLKDKNILIIKYFRGDYNELPIGNLVYHVDDPDSLTSKILSEKKVCFVKFPKIRNYIAKHFIFNSLSFLYVPILKNGEPIAVLTFDSKRKEDFTKSAIETIIPYEYILSTVISAKYTNIIDKEFSKWIVESRQNRILILGKDNGKELTRLLKIKNIINSMGYEGVLVKEYADIPEISNEDKVRTFAGLCRFVILENSFPGGQIVEAKICSTNRIVTAFIREEGIGSSFMVTDYSIDFNFMHEFTFVNKNEGLDISIREAINWAEKKCIERKNEFNKLYPWRSKPSA
jgi:putative methionine-R-sulfoxide reductase with GAF domain